MISGAIFAGVGDACFHTELYDNVGAMYPNDSASAFAVFKFIRVSILTALRSLSASEEFTKIYDFCRA